MPFLKKLPAEIRNEIYGMIATPTDAPFSEYKGLYLSCRQIKQEMDYECSRVFEKHVTKVHQDYVTKNAAALAINNRIPMQLTPSPRIGVCCIEITNRRDLWQRTEPHFKWFGLTSPGVDPEGCNSVAYLYLDVLRITLIQERNAYALDWSELFKSIRRFRWWNTSKPKNYFLSHAPEPRPRRTEVHIRLKTEDLDDGLYPRICVEGDHAWVGDGWDWIMDYRGNEEYSTIILTRAKSLLAVVE